jgi:hypothetical protein
MKSNSKENEELRLLFKTHIEDIRNCKKQQWYMLYLILIGIGGLISVAIQLDDGCVGLKWTLIVCSWVVVIIGSRFIYRYHTDIERYREIKVKIADTFEENARLISDISEKEASDMNKRDFKNVTLLFILIGIAAAFLATWIISSVLD